MEERRKRDDVSKMRGSRHQRGEGDREHRRHGPAKVERPDDRESERVTHDRADRKDRGERDRGDRADRVDRSDRGDRADRGESRVHIAQRAGQLKIFGAAHRRTAQEGQPREAVKKPSFAVPAAAPPFTKCRLMDEDWRVCVDAVHPHLMENGSEFTVVACIGAQGVGKSTALSLLLASLRGILDSSRGDRKQNSADFEAPLDIRSMQSFLEGVPSPGVDLCVSTLDRLLLLDAQPLFGDTSEAELRSELHFLLFLTSICHTLIVVTDTQVDLQLLKLMRLLATLKSKVPDLATWVHRQEKAEVREALPRLVFAFNDRSSLTDHDLFAPAQRFLEHTPWKATPTEFVRIPEISGSSVREMLTGSEAYSAGMRLRECVCSGSSLGRFGKDGLQLTEREWLFHISGYWEFVQKVPIIQECFSTRNIESYGWPKF